MSNRPKAIAHGRGTRAETKWHLLFFTRNDQCRNTFETALVPSSSGKGTLGGSSIGSRCKLIWSSDEYPKETDEGAAIRDETVVLTGGGATPTDLNTFLF